MVENNYASGATNLVAHQTSIITAANGSKAVGGTGGIEDEQISWCVAHRRRATAANQYGNACCDPRLGGIMIPCTVISAPVTLVKEAERLKTSLIQIQDQLEDYRRHCTCHRNWLL